MSTLRLKPYTPVGTPPPAGNAAIARCSDAAATAFAEKGYPGASTKDIAERLGDPAGQPLLLLPVQGGGARCHLRARGQGLHRAPAATFSRKPIPAADKLRAAIANHLSPLRTHPEADYIRVFMRHRHELPDGARQAVAALARTYQSLIEQLFAQGIASGEFRAELNPQLTTLALLGLCNSVITTRARCRALPASTTSSPNTHGS